MEEPGVPITDLQHSDPKYALLTLWEQAWKMVFAISEEAFLKIYSDEGNSMMSNQATMPRGNCLDWTGKCVNLAHSRLQVYEGKRYVLTIDANCSSGAISMDSGRGQLLERYLGLTELTGRMETQA